MFTQESAERITVQLVKDWNSQEINDFLNYFDDDVELISSNIQRLVKESNGHINGKETLRTYWEFARQKFPYFEYKLHEVSFDENKLILKFYNAIDDSYSNGILTFSNDMKIKKMVVSYV